MKKDAAQTILLVCVHYHNAPEVQAFLDHVQTVPVPTGCRLACALADNSGTWPDTHTEISVFRPDENLGYLNGLAFAVARWREENDQVPQWICLTNTDLTFEPSFFTRLSHLALPNDVGLVAPAIESPQGLPQNPFLTHRISARKIRFYQYIFRGAYRSQIYMGLHEFRQWLQSFSPPKPHPAQAIYAAHGSAILLQRQFFEAGGKLAYGGFLFGEEIHLAEQTRQIGLRVWYAPELQIQHRDGQILRHISKRQKAAWHRTSMDFLWQTYFRA